MNASHFRRAARYTALLLLSAALIACQSNVKTSVETFRDENRSFEVGRIKVVPGSDALKGSLEFDYFRSKLAERLAGVGFSPVEDDSAEFIAKLDYSVERQEVTDGSRTFVTTSLGYHRRFGGIIIADDYGNDFEYKRAINIEIAKVAPSSAAVQAKVIAIKANSVGSCEHLTVVYDEMLEAVFADFNRGNGSLEHIKVKGDTKCR